MPSPLFERGYEERRGGGGGGGGGGRDDDYNLSAYDNYARYSVEESRGYPNMPAMRGSTEGDRENPFRDNNAFQDAEDDALTKERGHSLTILERLKAKLG
jgi:hypothetical protein